MTLSCEYANSKAVEVVTVADVDAGKLVDNSLLQIWKLKFGHKTRFLKFKFSPDANVWFRF